MINGWCAFFAHNRTIAHFVQQDLNISHARAHMIVCCVLHGKWMNSSLILWCEQELQFARISRMRLINLPTVHNAICMQTPYWHDVCNKHQAPRIQTAFRNKRPFITPSPICNARTFDTHWHYDGECAPNDALPMLEVSINLLRPTARQTLNNEHIRNNKRRD